MPKYIFKYTIEIFLYNKDEIFLYNIYKWKNTLIILLLIKLLLLIILILL